MSVLYGVILFAIVGAFVLAPVFARTSTDRSEDPALADLEARRESKYREIRDAELDHASGKLSDADFAVQDAELRNEAVAILGELDEAQGVKPGEGGRAAENPGEPTGTASGDADGASS